MTNTGSDFFGIAWKMGALNHSKVIFFINKKIGSVIL